MKIQFQIDDEGEGESEGDGDNKRQTRRTATRFSICSLSLCVVKVSRNAIDTTTIRTYTYEMLESTMVWHFT